jgi:hypothetical protein
MLIPATKMCPRGVHLVVDLIRKRLCEEYGLTIPDIVESEELYRELDLGNATPKERPYEVFSPEPIHRKTIVAKSPKDAIIEFLTTEYNFFGVYTKSATGGTLSSKETAQEWVKDLKECSPDHKPFLVYDYLNDEPNGVCAIYFSRGAGRAFAAAPTISEAVDACVRVQQGQKKNKPSWERK